MCTRQQLAGSKGDTRIRFLQYCCDSARREHPEVMSKCWAQASNQFSLLKQEAHSATTLFGEEPAL